MSEPLGICELLARVGDEHIVFQNVVHDAYNFRLRKGNVTAITFLTNQITPTQVMNGTEEKIGLVVWLPKDRVTQAQRDHADGRSVDVPALPQEQPS